MFKNPMLRKAVVKGCVTGVMAAGVFAVARGACELATDAYASALSLKDNAIASLAESHGFELPKQKLTKEEIKRRLVFWAVKRNLQPSLVLSVAQVESGFNPELVSPVGAIGLMQIMPSNAKRVRKTVQQLMDAEHSAQGGTQILDEDIRAQRGSVRKGLQQYNGGPTCVRIIEECGTDLRCMGYVSERKKGCAESFLFAEAVLNLSARDLS